MALQKRSRLHKLLLTFDEDGKYVNGEALFQEGAWNTDTEAWEGSPIANEHPLTNMTPEGKKFLNDVIGVAAMKALETAAVVTEALKGASARAVAHANDANEVHKQLKDALGARDNFASLHKEAKGQLIGLTVARDEMAQGWRDADVKLEKIPGLIRRVFGAI